MPTHIRKEDLEKLRKTLEGYSPLPDGDFDLVAKVFNYKKFNKGEVVLQEGKVCRHIWFILKGCFRIFSIDDGQDVNVRFFFEDSIASDFISLRHEIPSHFFIVALEDTEVLYSYKPDYKPVLTISKSLLTLTTEFFAYNFYDEVEHSNSFKLMSPEERYNSLLASRPKFIQRIPLTYLASYLGMSRKTLSRIRSHTT